MIRRKKKAKFLSLNRFVTGIFFPILITLLFFTNIMINRGLEELKFELVQSKDWQEEDILKVGEWLDKQDKGLSSLRDKDSTGID